MAAWVHLPIHTARLEIRAFAPADREAMAPIYADPEVMRYIDTRGEDPSGWVLGYVEHQRMHGYSFWAVVERITGELIGEAGFAPFQDRGVAVPSCLEMGYLLRRDRWGRGLATEAAGACLAAAFAQLRPRSIVAIVDEGNDASLRVLAKLGFRATGSRTHHGRRQRVLRALAADRGWA